jgi:predicted nuclease of restriction endonuclease-like (RecB) superfamily
LRGKAGLPSLSLSSHPEESALETEAARLFEQVRALLSAARERGARSVNDEMVRAYWAVGRAVVEREQKGRDRAGYGERLVEALAERLAAEKAKGFTARNLRRMRAFYFAYPILNAVRSELSWTHYRLLLKVDNADARLFHEHEAARQNWSTRELERQISSLFYERAVLGSGRRETPGDARAQSEAYAPEEFAKDPYVLEFLGLPESPALREADLEAARLSHLQAFPLELGKGFAFVARQQRITVEGDHFYVDLVFYNRLLRRFLLIGLKVGKLTHQDIGQMRFYVNYYARGPRGVGEPGDRDSPLRR